MSESRDRAWQDGMNAPGQPGEAIHGAAPECQTTHSEPNLDLLAKLKEKNLAAQGFMVLEGRIAIERALDAGIVPRFLVCTEAEEEYWRRRSGRGTAMPDDSSATQSAAGVNDAAAPRSATSQAFSPAFPVRAMSHEALCALVDFKFHRGALAIADMPRIAPFEYAGHRGAHGGQYEPPDADERGVRPGEKTEPREVFLCLWNVTDPSNLGALVRTAAGLGLTGVLLGPGCASPYYRKTIRASMGNVFSIPILSASLGTLEFLNRNGARILAAALTAKAVPPEELGLRSLGVAPGSFGRPENRRSPVILILGNEGYGLPAEVLKLCTDEVR
ncbi:MAG: TrmH family RNA methyltransferase, partial [Rectinema sp.]